MEPYQNLASRCGAEAARCLARHWHHGWQESGRQGPGCPTGLEHARRTTVYSSSPPLQLSVAPGQPPGLNVLASSSVVEDGDAEVQERKTYTGVVQNSTRQGPPETAGLLWDHQLSLTS